MAVSVRVVSSGSEDFEIRLLSSNSTICALRDKIQEKTGIFWTHKNSTNPQRLFLRGKLIDSFYLSSVGEANICSGDTLQLVEDETLRCDQKGETYLHKACDLNLCNIAKLLIERGEVDIEAKTAVYQLSPLHLSCGPEIAEAMIGVGADLECKDMWGMTPFLRYNMTSEDCGLDTALLFSNLNATDKKGLGLLDIMKQFSEGDYPNFTFFARDRLPDFIEHGMSMESRLDILLDEEVELKRMVHA